jgi:hypothetical protein
LNNERGIGVQHATFVHSSQIAPGLAGLQ